MDRVYNVKLKVIKMSNKLWAAFTFDTLSALHICLKLKTHFWKIDLNICKINVWQFNVPFEQVKETNNDVSFWDEVRCRDWLQFENHIDSCTFFFLFLMHSKCHFFQIEFQPIFAKPWLQPHVFSDDAFDSQLALCSKGRRRPCPPRPDSSSERTTTPVGWWPWRGALSGPPRSVGRSSPCTWGGPDLGCRWRAGWAPWAGPVGTARRRLWTPLEKQANWIILGGNL